MEEGQRMTNYQRVRKELGTISYNRIIEPNRLEEYALYMKDENEIRSEIVKDVQASKKKENKHIKIEKGKQLFDFLEENNKELKEKASEEASVKQEQKESGEKIGFLQENMKKRIMIVGSLKPDAEKNELKL